MVLLFVITVLIFYITDWDFKDKQRVKDYLHRDLKRYGKRYTEPFMHHINAIINSIGEYGFLKYALLRLNWAIYVLILTRLLFVYVSMLFLSPLLLL